MFFGIMHRMESLKMKNFYKFAISHLDRYFLYMSMVLFIWYSLCPYNKGWTGTFFWGGVMALKGPKMGAVTWKLFKIIRGPGWRSPSVPTYNSKGCPFSSSSQTLALMQLMVEWIWLKIFYRYISRFQNSHLHFPFQNLRGIEARISLGSCYWP